MTNTSELMGFGFDRIENIFLSFNYTNTRAISPTIYFFLYTTDIFRAKTDIQRIILEHFLHVNITFYDAVTMIHDIITTPYPFPYTAKFMFVGNRNNKTQQIRR